MSAFVLIESRCAAEASEGRGFLETAAQLSGAGHEVDLFLIQNGVLLAVRGVDSCLAALPNHHHIFVWADNFSLQTRGVDTSELAPGIRVAGMQELMKLL